jgi:hypothetical protein
MVAEDLACEAFQAIPVDRSFDLLLRDRQTDTSLTLVTLEGEYRKIGIRGSLVVFEDPFELRCCQQARRTREPSV